MVKAKTGIPFVTFK